MKRYTLILAVLCLVFAPLIGACQMQDNDEFLLNGKDPASKYFHDSNVCKLAQAAAAGRGEEVAQLIARGVDPNSRGDETLTPLMWAVAAGNAAGVKALLNGGSRAQMPITLVRHGPNNSPVSIQRYPIEMAAEHNRPDLMQALLESGADSGTGKGTPHDILFLSAQCLPCVKLLVEHGANINREIVGGSGANLVRLATSNRYYDVILYSLELGYNVNLDELNYDIETGGISDDLKPLRSQILALLKSKDVKPWLPPYCKNHKDQADTAYYKEHCQLRE